MPAVIWVGILTALACFPVIGVFVGVRSYRAEAAFFRPQRRTVPWPTGVPLPGLEAIAFQVEHGFTLRGWYVPSRNRAGIILTHGSGGDRRDVLDEAVILSRGGFGVLMFDWPGHGESEGEIHWNAGERSALAGMLGRLPALWAIERGGLPVSVLQPKDSVRQITPRPLLVIGGTRDNVVPAFMARALYAAAREPKQLLLVEGAGHGRYESADPVGYPGQLVAFFERALLAANDP